MDSRKKCSCPEEIGESAEYDYVQLVTAPERKRNKDVQLCRNILRISKSLNMIFNNDSCMERLEKT